MQSAANKKCLVDAQMARGRGRGSHRGRGGGQAHSGDVDSDEAFRQQASRRGRAPREPREQFELDGRSDSGDGDGLATTSLQIGSCCAWP